MRDAQQTSSGTQATEPSNEQYEFEHNSNTNITVSKCSQSRSQKRRRLQQDLEHINNASLLNRDNDALLARIMNNLDDGSDEDAAEDKRREQKEALHHPASSSNAPPTTDKQPISEAQKDEKEIDSTLATINDGKHKG